MSSASVRSRIAPVVRAGGDLVYDRGWILAGRVDERAVMTRRADRDTVGVCASLVVSAGDLTP